MDSRSLCQNDHHLALLGVKLCLHGVAIRVTSEATEQKKGHLTLKEASPRVEEVHVGTQD